MEQQFFEHIPVPPENNDYQPRQSKGRLKIYFIAVLLIIAAFFLMEYFGRNNNQSVLNLNNQANEQENITDNQNTATPAEESNVYFSRSGDEDCGRVYPVQRALPQGAEPISTALINLFSGPNANERSEGYTSFFSNQTAYILHYVRVSRGLAYVDLKDIRNIIPNASSACGSLQLLTQIGETLKQFPEISDFRVAIDGDPAPFYEWLQLGCQGDLCDKTPFMN